MFPEEKESPRHTEEPEEPGALLGGLAGRLVERGVVQEVRVFLAGRQHSLALGVGASDFLSSCFAPRRSLPLLPLPFSIRKFLELLVLSTWAHDLRVRFKPCSAQGLVRYSFRQGPTVWDLVSALRPPDLGPENRTWLNPLTPASAREPLQHGNHVGNSKSLCPSPDRPGLASLTVVNTY